jgi:hypothetical protein
VVGWAIAAATAVASTRATAVTGTAATRRARHHPAFALCGHAATAAATARTSLVPARAAGTARTTTAWTAGTATARTAPIAAAWTAVAIATVVAAGTAAAWPSASTAVARPGLPARLEVDDIVKVALLLGVRRRVLAAQHAHQPHVVGVVAHDIERLHQPGQPIALDAERLLDLRPRRRGALLFDGLRLGLGGRRRRFRGRLAGLGRRSLRSRCSLRSLRLLVWFRLRGRGRCVRVRSGLLGGGRDRLGR